MRFIELYSPVLSELTWERKMSINKYIHRFSGLLISLALFSRATGKTVTFNTAETGSVSFVNWENLDKDGKVIGNTPVTINASDLKGRIVKISVIGKAPQYWVFSDIPSVQTKIDLRLIDSCAGSASVKVRTTRDANRSHSMLMKAYQALSNEDYKLARELAEKLSDFSPRLAAPFIIVGLSYLQEGKKEKARISFNKAKALDPADSDISKLLKTVE